MYSTNHRQVSQEDICRLGRASKGLFKNPAPKETLGPAYERRAPRLQQSSQAAGGMLCCWHLVDSGSVDGPTRCTESVSAECANIYCMHVVSAGELTIRR